MTCHFELRKWERDRDGEREIEWKREKDWDKKEKNKKIKRGLTVCG